jgi:hypothetical protein
MESSLKLKNQLGLLEKGNPPLIIINILNKVSVDKG